MEYDFTGGQEWIPWKEWIKKRPNDNLKKIAEHDPETSSLNIVLENNNSNTKED